MSPTQSSPTQSSPTQEAPTQSAKESGDPSASSSPASTRARPRQRRPSKRRAKPLNPAWEQLSSRQQRILAVIVKAVAKRGYPPSVREIGEAVGLTSPSSVAHQLSVLERKGFLRRDPNRPRAIEVVVNPERSAAEQTAPASSGDANPAEPTTQGLTQGLTMDTHTDQPSSPTHLRVVSSHPDLESPGPAPRYVPFVGRIAAGVPITAEQVVEEVMPLPAQLVGEGTLFMVQVHGDSMIDAAICNGDWVVVRHQPDANSGDIVAAMFDGEATVKTFRIIDGHPWLYPANPAFDPMPAEEANLLGIVKAVMRKL